jgi:hypothetical protein
MEGTVPAGEADKKVWKVMWRLVKWTMKSGG